MAKNTGKTVAKKEKTVSAARAAAIKALESAGSDQEKRVARQNLKLVKFGEIAPKRVSRAILALRNVAKVCNRSGYAWTPEQATQILKALETEAQVIITALKQQAADKGDKKAQAFAFAS